MMPAMAKVRVQTEREVKGPAHVARYPERAADLWVTVYVAGKGKRQKIGPPIEENQRRAEEMREDWQLAIDRRLGARKLPIPTFRSAARAYKERGLRNRAPKTIAGRTYQADALADHFGDIPLDQVGVTRVLEWWDAFVVGGGRDWRTGSHYLTVISLIFRQAQRDGAKVANPVADARKLVFDDIVRTKAYQSRNQDNLNGMTAAELAALLPQLEAEPADFRIAVLLLYESGLRFGEMTALTWGGVWLGKDDHDTSRHIHVRESVTDGKQGGTKTGRWRKVGISRRMRRVLLEWQVALGSPAADVRVVRATWGGNFRSRLRRVCRRAKIAPRTPKDLRDTYASLLITHGIVLKWISLQLGHAKVATTETHYAAYMAVDGYQNPWIVPKGCLPPDLFSELDGWRPAALHQTSPRLHHAREC